MKTWILIKGIPPELYGINLEKWKKEQTTEIRSKRRIKRNQLKKAKGRGAKIILDEGDFLLIEEPSKKEDTAGKIFKDIRIKFRVNQEIFKDLQKPLNLPKSDFIQYMSYYSAKKRGKVIGFFLTKDKSDFKKKTKEKVAGSQEIIFKLNFPRELRGILIVSYKRKRKNFYQYEGSVLARRYEKSLDIEKIPETFGLPSTLEINEDRITYKIFEED